MDHCNNNTTAKRREFDLFAFIFNSDGEEDEPTAEPQDEDAPLVDLTVDSDEDGAGNSAVVIQQNQSQNSSRLPRRAQPSKLQEPAEDSEDEDDGDGDDEDEDEDEDELSDDVDSSVEESSLLMRVSQKATQTTGWAG